jgi:glutathione synthase
MKLLFILDPLISLKTYKDTSLAIMREAAARGHKLYVCQQHDIMLRFDCIKFAVKGFTFNQDGTYQTDTQSEVLSQLFDAIIMRKDPPFDNEYLYSTHLLEMAAHQGTRVINNPASVRNWNEKLSIARFPEFAPEFLVTSDADLIRGFLCHYQDIIIKPLDGMGGSGIFRLTESDPNIGVILETATKFGTQTIMAQRYLPAILQGDKRIIVINGEPIPYALARIPKAGETRGNLAAGGIGVAQPLTKRDLEIATTVGKMLKEKGLFLVGLDVIGEHLTEINVTSPTGMVEIAAQTQALDLPCKPAQVFIEALEAIH